MLSIMKKCTKTPWKEGTWDYLLYGDRNVYINTCFVQGRLYLLIQIISCIRDYDDFNYCPEESIEMFLKIHKWRPVLNIVKPDLIKKTVWPSRFLLLEGERFHFKNQLCCIFYITKWNIKNVILNNVLFIYLKISCRRNQSLNII